MDGENFCEEPMQSRITRGSLAGIAGGIVFGVMMQMMNAPTPDGGSMPMMAMVAMVVRSTNIAVGWIYHLFNSAVIGILFALLLGRRVNSNVSGVAWGASWGLLWWILGGLILMPLLLGMPAFASLKMPPMRPVAMESLVGHLVYGILLGVSYARLSHAEPMPVVRGVPH
ncbi:MAG: hypothetical protein ABIS29_01435 [Vicinamibacterales bacterium]